MRRGRICGGIRAAAREAERFGAIRRATLTGRPCGEDGFTAELERRLGRELARKKPGRKPKSKEEEDGQMELV
jgi:hypothetical protein